MVKDDAELLEQGVCQPDFVNLCVKTGAIHISTPT